MTTLFDLTAQAERLLYNLEKLDGLGPPYERQAAKEVLSLELGKAEQELAEKVDGYVYVYDELMGRAALQKEEAQKLMKLARANLNRAQALKDIARMACEFLERKKLKGKTREIIVSSGGFKVIITDEDAVPPQFQELVPASYVVRKKLITDHIKATGEVPAGVETEAVVRVRFK